MSTLMFSFLSRSKEYLISDSFFPPYNAINVELCYSGMGPYLELLAQGIIEKVVEKCHSKMIACSEGHNSNCKYISFYFL